MNLSNPEQQLAGKRSRHLWRVVHQGVWGASNGVLLVRMPGERPYDFPSPAIRSGENPMIYRLWRNPGARLTVKFKSKTPRKILPSDLPSKRFAGRQLMR